MSNQLKVNRIVGVSLLLFPLMSFSDVATETSTTTVTPVTPTTNSQPTPSSAPTEIKKDLWLSSLKKVISEPICKGFTDDASIGARLKERNISFDDCVGLIPGIAEKCQAKYYNEIPAMINKDLASKWGRTLGECIGGDFAVNHLYSPQVDKPKTP